jgi:hypothetical protein
MPIKADGLCVNNKVLKCRRLEKALNCNRLRCECECERERIQRLKLHCTCTEKGGRDLRDVYKLTE